MTQKLSLKKKDIRQPFLLHPIIKDITLLYYIINQNKHTL